MSSYLFGVRGGDFTREDLIGVSKIEIFNQVKSQTGAGVRFPATLVASATWFLATE